MIHDSKPVHLSLFHTGRAQCPECGAPLLLTEGRPLAECHYCGAASLVERRLRTIEPLPAPEFITLDAPVDAARRIKPSHTVPQIAQDESHCPTCGAFLDGAAQTQAISQCRQCGTESKIEQRLVRRLGVDEDLTSLERDATDGDRRHFAATEVIIHRIVKGTDLDDRVRAAYEFTESWQYFNVAAVRLLPQVLETLRHCEAQVDIPLAEYIGKLLCDGDPRLARSVMRAAEKVTFDENGSRSLLWQLGLGSGICLKLLLDSADYAATRGGIDYACAALWGVNMIFERNFAKRVTLAEIVLYRLLYLRGPVQAWALELVKGQMGLGVRFPTPTLLRFMDDCVYERPELVPHIRECFYTGGAETEADYLDRLAFIDQLFTEPAKCAALEQLLAPPRNMAEETVAAVLEKLLVYALQPQFAKSAVYAINVIFEDYPGPRHGVHAFIRAHGNTLPEAIRRAYLSQVPKTTLLTQLPHVNMDYDAPHEKSAFDQQLEQWNQMWRDGIGSAVQYQTDRQQAAREYWAKLKEHVRSKP